MLRNQEGVALLIEWHGLEPADRLVVDIGDTQIQLQILHGREDGNRGERSHGEAHRRIAFVERQRHRGDEGQRAGNDTETQISADAAFHASMSCFMLRASPTRRRAQSSTRSRSGVNPRKREPR